MYKYEKIIEYSCLKIAKAFDNHKYIISLLADISNISADFAYDTIHGISEKLEYEPTVKELTNWVREEEGNFSEQAIADLLNACDTIHDTFERWNVII